MNGRDPECVKAWPECRDGGYDPHCCRFPKSCSCGGESGDPVDGAGLQPNAHASMVADLLDLQPSQVVALLAELRNALVPVRYWAEKGDPRVLAGITRVLLLADAVDVRSRR